MTPEVALDRADQVNAVIALIESGMSEKAACDKVGVNRATFRSAAFKLGAADKYARALEALAQDQVEKMERVIDEMRSGELKPEIARIELDNRRWFASKFLPKRYGDKVQVGGDPDNPITHAVDAETLSRIDALITEAAKLRNG